MMPTTLRPASTLYAMLNDVPSGTLTLSDGAVGR
jgi:hypothetical protein